MKISIVIPLHNENLHIGNVLRDVAKYKLPIVLVDDGSTDNSYQKAKNLKIKNLTILSHKINLGKGAAMKTGADYAIAKKSDAVIFMDSDGQHVASDLQIFIKTLKTGKFDVVLGSRNFNYGVPLVRYLGNKVASMIMVLLFNIYVSDVICGYRAVTEYGYSKIRWDSDGYGVETEMVARIGKNKLKMCEVPVQTIYHNSVKGVTILDAFEVLGNVLKWKVTL